jgi:hypothetical protein
LFTLNRGTHDENIFIFFIPLQFCGELVRQGISHVCILDASSLATSGLPSRHLFAQCRGGWSVLQLIARDLQSEISLEPPLQLNIQR